jgi:hypothetical protein
MKGSTDAQGSYSSYVQPGVYTLKVIAQGFQRFGTQITIEAGKVVAVQAGLTPVSALPSISPMPTPVPVALSASAPR